MIQPVGGQWDITCSSQSTPNIVMVAWETSDGVELLRSNSHSVTYTAPADITQELICYGWDIYQTKTPLMFATLIAQGA